MRLFIKLIAIKITFLFSFQAYADAVDDWLVGLKK